MNKKILLLILCIISVSYPLFSEEDTMSSEEPQGSLNSLFDTLSEKKDKAISDSTSNIESEDQEVLEEESPALTITQQIALMEITHFSMDKLRRWVLGLNLSAQGEREALQKRLLEYYDIPLEFLEAPVIEVEEQEDNIIRIVSADSLKSVSISVINETYLSAQGSVFVELPGDGEQWLAANSIIYNKDLDIATAYGNVSFKSVDNTSDSPITGGYVSVLGSGESTIILDGSTSVGESAMLLQGEDFYIDGETIILNPGEVSLRKGTITSDPHDDPYYRIQANRARSYSDGTFYLQGAALYLGRVPTFYFPAFIYPGKSFSFHPSFGIDSTYGFYFNTTTYLWGRHSGVSRQADNESGTSLFNFISDNSGDQYYDLRGFYVEPRDTQSPREEWAEKTGSSLALVADYYTRSGLFLGVFYEKTKKLGPFSKIQLGGGLANSYHIYKNIDESFSRFVPGTTNRTRFYTYFLGSKIPFRFFWDINLAVSLGKVSGSIKLPYYSDPYLESQFAIGRYFEERKQDITLGELLFNPLSSTSRDIERKKSSLNWSMNLSWNPRFSHQLIKGFRLSAFEINLLWRQQTLSPQPTHIGSSVLYNESIYLPKTLQLPLISMQLGGVIFKGSIKNTSNNTVDRKAIISEKPVTAESIINTHRESVSVMYSDEELAKRDDTNYMSTNGLTHRGLQPYDYISLPYSKPWSKPKTSYKLKEYFSNSLEYRSSLKSETLYHFNFTTLNPEEQIMSYKHYAEYNFKGDLSITYKAKFIEDLFTVSNKMSLSGKYKNYFDRSTMVDENGELLLPDSKWDSITKDEEKSTYFWIKNSLSVTMRPFFVNDYWGESFITYSLQQNIFDYEYDFEEEMYLPTWHSWSSKEVTNHTVEGALIFDSPYVRGELKTTSSLPPRNNLQQAILPKLSFFMGEYLTLMADTSISRVGSRKEEESPYTFTDWTQQDYNITLFGDFPIMSFSEKLTFGVGENKGDIFSTTTLDFKLFNEKFLIKNLLLTDLKEQVINAYQLKLSLYNFETTYEFAKMGLQDDLKLINSSYRWEHTYNPKPFWRNRFYDITLKPDFLFSIDHLNKFNNSLTLGATIKFKIFEFLDLSFSAHSQNDATFKYFDGDGGFLVTDVLVDLFKSINFFHTPHREQSPFKLNSVDVSFIHYMRDWTFTFSLKGDFTYRVDYNDPNLSGFRWIPEYVFAVQWTPLKEMSYNARIYKDDNGEIIIENEKK